MSEADQNNLENCGEVVTTETETCEENPNQPGCSGPGVSPPIVAEESTPFLAPYDTIRVGPREMISTDREINVINRGLFGQLASQDLDLQGATLEDKIRSNSNKFWRWDGKEEKFVSDSYVGRARVEIASEEYGRPEDSMTKRWKGKINVIVRDHIGQYWVEQTSREVKTYLENSPYSLDTVFAAPQPFFESEMDNVMSATSNTVSIKAEVGYYEEKPEVPEIDLPSLYRSYYRMITCPDPESEDSCPIPKCFPNDTVQKFTSDAVSVMKEANEVMKRSFNQYVEITINTQQMGKVATLADRFQMDKYFLELVSNPDVEVEKYVEVLDESMTIPTEDGSGSRRDEALPNDRFYPSAEERTTSDPFHGPNGISGLRDRPQDYFESLDDSQYPLKYEYWDNDAALRFTDMIRSQIFMNNIETQMLNPQKMRSLSDIFNGEKAFSEIIGYRIAKHNVTVIAQPGGSETYEVDPEPIQQFYFMDSDKVLDIQFVDTQVNAGKSYVYRVHSLNMVFGTEIIYDGDFLDPSSDETPTSFMNVDFTCEDHVRIIEAPFFEKFVSVIERPPLAPQVSFIPLQGRDDEMEILLCSNFGEEFKKPVSIFPQDQILINKMMESQPPRPDGSLEYQTDSLPEEFQILRIESPPESYSDFASTNFVKTLKTSGRTLMYKDTDFLPNKDYYYCFRAIDKIGISNPSLVYKVRLNSYLDGIFLDIKQYEMRPLVDTSFNLCIQRALKIQPSFEQIALRFPDFDDLDTFDFARNAPTRFGIGDDESEYSVWGKKFKVRLTSKQTGRRIDVNLDLTRKYLNKVPFPSESGNDEGSECE
jgi:hypothetical protein